MPDPPSSESETMLRAAARRRAQRPSSDLADKGRRAALAQVIPRRAGVSWWLGLVLAAGFAALVTPAITAERWPLRLHAGTPTEPGTVTANQPAPFTVRAPMFARYDNLRIGGGVVVARGEAATAEAATIADAIADAMPRGPVLYAAVFALIFVLATIFTHHMRRSTRGRLVRVQVVSLAGLAALAAAVKLVLLATALSVLVVPVAVVALVPTMVLDRTVGLATGVLAALVVSLLAPFDVGLSILLLVQAATAGLVVAERPKRRWLAALGAGLVTTLCTGATYLLLTYLSTGQAPELRDPLHSAWVATAIGPALAAILAVPLIPLYQLLVGEITQGKLVALEDLGHPLLRQIAEQSPGTWQHSLMMANMAEIAANAIGANGRLVRVGAYFHDLGKSLSPRYFIENLAATEPSPHDQLPPDASCDAIFAHVTEGIVTARKAGLPERIIDFMHMHHGNGVLEYFWAKCREQGNPHDFTIEDFRYPGHPPQSRETAILAICDAVEAASRTLQKPDAAAIDALVQRIVYGKLHLGQLDESGLSMSDLRRISDSLRETIRHANHGRIEYPWQKAGQDASASVMTELPTSPKLDSLDRKPRQEPARRSSAPPPIDSAAALAATADIKGAPPEAAPPRAAVHAPGREGPPWEAAPDAASSPWGNPASEQRIPIANGAPPGSESSDALKIRAGTARNTQDAVPVLIREVPLTIPGRAPGPLPPPDRSTAPVDLDDAITNPPPLRRGPSGHPPVPSEPAQLAAELASTVSRPTAPPPSAPRPPEEPSPRGGQHADVDSATAHPAALGAPPRTTGLAEEDRRPLETLRGHGGESATLHRGPATSDPAPATRPGGSAADARPTSRLSVLLLEDEARVTAARAAVKLRGAVPDAELDAGATEPSMPILAIGDERRVDLPLPQVPPASAPAERKPGWASGLAARIDAALDSNEWTHETPIVPPTQAELRALLGQPDPTRQQPIDEIAVLQRRAAELADVDPQRRAPHPTTEVDPDDIEAAIEIAPPARRPTNANAIGVARPKKSE